MSNQVIPRSDITVSLDRVFTVIALVHHIIVFAWISRKNAKAPEVHRNSKWQQPVWWITAAFLVFQILLQSKIMVFTLGVSCTAIGIICGILSFLARLSFWLYNLVRLKSTCDDKYHLPTPFFVWTAIAMCVVCLFQIFFAATGLIYYSEDLGDYCLVHSAKYGVTTLSADTFFNVGCAIVFWFQKKRIHKMTEDDSLLYMAKKGLVLNVAMIIGVIVDLVILYLTDVMFFSAIEKMFTVWCLILFDDRLDGIYNKVVCCFAGKRPPSMQKMAELAQGGMDGNSADMEEIVTEQPVEAEDVVTA